MKPRIAVVGAGLIGRRHVHYVSLLAALHSIVDPARETRSLAAEFGAKWFADLSQMIKQDAPDGIIVATPTPCHIENAMVGVSAGIPVLIEKPIADDIAGAQGLVDAAKAAGVALLVGHHRRYNPIIRKAKGLIDRGRLGKLISLNAMCWLYKPDDYFNVDWRRQKGAGPILTNLIHDVDLMRYLCGEIIEVQAMKSAEARGYVVEDTAAILLKFASGALGTITVSDTIVSPWSWELTAAENHAYPQTDQTCYMIGGTKGSLSLPDLKVWYYGAKAGWHEPILHDEFDCGADDPLALQIGHFCDVITGQEKPLVSGAEGLETLRVIDAIRNA